MKISDTRTTVFPADLWRKQSKKSTTENAVPKKEASVSPDTDTIRQRNTSVLDLYYRMQQTKRAAREESDNVQPEEAVRDKFPEQEESETKTEIIVKPDGSRVLVITTMTGGLETTMSLEIAKPQDESFCPDDAEADKASEMLQEPCPSPEAPRS